MTKRKLPISAQPDPITTIATTSSSSILKTTLSKALHDESVTQTNNNNNKNKNNRRRLLSLMAAAAGSSGMVLSHAAAAMDEVSLPNSNDNESVDKDDDTTRIYELKSGVQFRNIRMGQGQPVTADTTVVLHVQCLLRNGHVLLDTRSTADGNGGQPIVYTLGSALSTPGPWLIPPGLDDALVSRGVTADNGQRVPPMRQGGVRLVVVPASLGYGSAGLSRFQAWQLSQSNSNGGGGGGAVTVREPVPRDEMLRYEVEVLRCIDVPSSSRMIQACCSEEVYPCRIPGV